MKKVLLFFVLSIPLKVFSQAQVVIKGTSPVYIVETSSPATKVYIDLNNPSPNAINTIGTQGWIISEAENSILKWDIGTTPAITSTYTVPFGGTSQGTVLTFPYTNYRTWSGTPYTFPLPLAVTFSPSSGSPGGSVNFSTWHTDPDNGDNATSPYNSAPYGSYPDKRPSDVTNMASSYAGGDPSNVDNSYNAVDRFWVIDANSYISKPAVTGNGITMTWTNTGEPELGSPNNPAMTNNLIAQRFNPTIVSHGSWGDWSGPYNPNSNAATGSTFSSSVTASNFYRSWTLVNENAPLPIVLESTPVVQCVNGAAEITWTSETEINNAFFTITKSSDGIHWLTVATVKGAGNSNLPVNYSYFDGSPYSGVSYYMLSQTNYDGLETSLSTIQFNGCSDVPNSTIINAFNAGPYIDIQISAAESCNYQISLVNMLGQILMTTTKSVQAGSNEFRLNNAFSAGIYLVTIQNNQTSYSKKLVLGVR